MKKIILILLLCCVGATIAGGITKKIWLCIDTGFESIDDFRKQTTFGIDEVVEVEVTCGVETKQFTYEEFFGLLGFGKTESIEIIVILDRSGSMEIMKDDMIGGLKQFISDQKKVSSKANFTLVQFDTEYEIIYDSVDIQKVSEIDLVPRGNTALLDAIGETLNRVYMQKAICVIITDGLENSSTIYTKPEVVRLIESRKKFGWKFIYLGANQDAIQEGSSLGLNIVDCSTFDTVNVSGTLNTMSTNVTSFRNNN